MKSAGTWTEGNRDRIKFRCPLKMSKKRSEEHRHVCPANHPSFDTGTCYDCTKYLDVTDDVRSRVPRGSKEFKDTFKNTTGKRSAGKPHAVFDEAGTGNGRYSVPRQFSTLPVRG